MIRRSRIGAVGVLLPTRELAISGNFGMEPVLEFARTAESLGFDALWTGDSLSARRRLDPFIVLASVAAVTERIKMGTAALTPALRHPLIGAALAAGLDQASAGRLELALGSGFPIPESEQEFESVGVPFAGRAGRLDETVALWRQAWRAASVPATESAAAEPGYDQFHGRYWQGGQLSRLSPPASPEGPPLWLAGSDTPRVVARVARHYDGWMPFLPDAEAYGRAWNRIRELAVGARRRPGAITAGLYATVNVNEDRQAARDELEGYVQSYYKRSLDVMSTIQAYSYGSASECAEWLRRYIRSGARHIVLRIGSLDPATQLKTVGDVLMPAIRAAVHEEDSDG